jgi:ankyrin repeat protein
MSSSAISADLQLSAAAKDGSVRSVNAALARDTNINAVDDSGRSALYFAAVRGCVETLKVLLSAGAQVDIIANNGWCALHCAVEKGWLGLVKILVKVTTEPLDEDHGYGSPWYLALKQGDPDIVSVFIQAGVDLNKSFGPAKLLPLTVAANFHHTAIIAMLVEHGADVNGVNTKGSSVLITALCAGNLPTVSSLLDLGADPHLTDSHGFTTLDWCILQGGRVPVMRRLLAAGAYIPPGTPPYRRSDVM